MAAVDLLAGVAMTEPLFDHIPEIVFFLKDQEGRYVAVNQSLVERCGLKGKGDILGKHVRDLFPAELARRYASQDKSILRTGRPIIDRLELHWYASRKSGWCLTTKLPLKDPTGRIIGLVGISRDIRIPGESESIPESLASALEYLESRFDEPLTPALLAKHARLSPFRFARLIKRIFRLTPGQLIVQRRLNAAARMLRENDRSVAEIALACGFYDHSAFSRAFRSATGQTPSQHRSSGARKSWP